MRLFVCSDIHGNARALEEVLKVHRELSPCVFLSLGDVVGYGPDSADCLEKLRKLPRSILLMGNHEDALLNESKEVELNSQARRAIRKTREQLRGGFDSFIAGDFKLVERCDSFTASHGSPIDPELFSYVFGSSEAMDIFKGDDSPLFFVGHTHVPAVMDSGGAYTRVAEGGTYKLEKGKRYLVNPGSVGQPRDGDPRASFCFYDSTAGEVTFYKLEYDVKAEYEEYLKQGFPVGLAERLLRGV